MFSPTWGKPILNMFQMGWFNHQLGWFCVEFVWWIEQVRQHLFFSFLKMLDYEFMEHHCWSMGCILTYPKRDHLCKVVLDFQGRASWCWGIICHLPPFTGTKKNHWLYSSSSTWRELTWEKITKWFWRCFFLGYIFSLPHNQSIMVQWNMGVSPIIVVTFQIQPVSTEPWFLRQHAAAYFT